MDSETQKSESLYDFLAWLETNKKRVALGGLAALVLIGVVVTVSWYGSQKEYQASEALSAIRLPYNPLEPLPADTMSKLRKLTEDYAGTAAAVRAELVLAGLAYTDGKYAEAQAAFEKFIREHPDNRWVGQAYFGTAACLDAQNKVNEAITKYQDFISRSQSDPNVDQARMNLAALYETADKPADALKEYDKIAKAVTPSPSTSEAQERYRKLLIKHPNLAPVPTNRPPVTPAMPSLTTTGATTVVRSNIAPATNVPLIIRTNVSAPSRLLATNAPPAK